MKTNDYQENYTKNYDNLSSLDTKPNKKPSFLTILLIGLLVLLVCSLGYDNWLKPYLAERKQQEEQTVVDTLEETDDVSIETKFTDDEDDITSIEDDNDDYDIIDVKPTSTKPVTSRKVDANPSSTPSQPVVEPIEVNAESPLPSQPQTIMDSSPKRTRAKSEDYSGLSTSEILDRQTHAMVMKQAQQAGVSTEGSTTDILERINHASIVKQAQRAGVSTEGSTTDILERINHASVVKQARRMGVSTEGSTTDILERINHASVVKQARRMGVSTEGSTSEISERIMRKNMERMGY